MGKIAAVAPARDGGVADQRSSRECRIPQSLGAHNQRGVLSQLTLRNFAIVDRLQIDWHAGLNVITGETGAGKSILIDAVGALLGDRLGPDMVRSGAQRALVEGVFSLPERLPDELAATLEELELEPEDGALIVSREIAGGGGMHPEKNSPSLRSIQRKRTCARLLRHVCSVPKAVMRHAVNRA